MALVRIPRLPALMRLPRWGSARSWAVALALLACVLPHASHADVVISNVPIATNGGTTLSSTDSKALIFTTGTVWRDDLDESRVASPVNVTGRVVVALWAFFESS